MFGDLGHGFLMFLFGLYCILNEKRFSEEKDQNEVRQTLSSYPRLLTRIDFENYQTYISMEDG